MIRQVTTRVSQATLQRCSARSTERFSFNSLPSKTSSSSSTSSFFSSLLSAQSTDLCHSLMSELKAPLSSQIITPINSNQFVRFYTSYPTHTILEFPALSPSMEKGTIGKWLIKAGEELKEGQLLAEVETDKATSTWESMSTGYIAKILVPEGQSILVNHPVLVVVEEKADIPAFADFTLSTSPAPTPAAASPSPAPAASPTASPAAPAPPSPAPAAASPGRIPPPSSGSRIYSSPAARAVAAEKSVNLAEVAGTGPNGRVIKQDVLEYSAVPKIAPTAAAVASPPPSVSSSTAFTDLENSNVRRVIAARLTQSKQQVPHYYLTIEFCVDELEAVRKTLNAQAGDQYKLSVNDFIIKASALTLKEVPEVNSSWNESSIRRYHTVGINVAINTDHGLFSPLIPNTDAKGLVSISKSVKELAEKAKNKKLSLGDLESGTFTISNLGMFGIKSFTAVINPPQACILAVGGIEEKVVVNKKATSDADKFKVSKFMTCTMSCDHRVVDGAIGARWLASFKKLVETPLNMLL